MKNTDRESDREHDRKHDHGREHARERTPDHAPEHTRHPAPEDQVLKLFHTCSHLLYHRGGNRGQARILLLLQKYGECTQRDLQDHAGIRSASLSELLSRMEAAGILSRGKCEEDRRNVRIALTEEGRRMAELQAQEELIERRWLLAPLSVPEQAQLSGILQKLCDHWITGIRPEDIDHITKDDRSSLR